MHVNQKKILICPLDWGLGHATRCMPLIEYFIEKKCEVIIAGNEKTNNLIKNEFPALKYLYIKGYEIKYSKNKFFLAFMLLKQIPKILRVIKCEHHWLQNNIEQEKIDLVISDNRYGLFTKKIPCVFITHQINIAVPQSAMIEKLLNKINHYFIKKFTHLWIPDYEENSIAGKLSKNTIHHSNLSYIGILSRFNFQENVQKKYKYLFLISGPEPQRNIFEQLIFNQIKEIKSPVLVIRGLPDSNPILNENNYITITNHLSKSDLQNAILQSEIIICRSGYSTIMDLIKLNKHAILIPTPAQTEQEYLASYLVEKKWFLILKQHEFIFKEIEKLFTEFDFIPFDNFQTANYKYAIDSLLLKYKE